MVLLRTPGMYVDMADDLDWSMQVFSGSGPASVPSTKFSVTFQGGLAWKPWKKETQSSAKSHLFSFSFSLVPVNPFETFSGLGGRQIFCYTGTWPLDVDGREWMSLCICPWTNGASSVVVCTCVRFCISMISSFPNQPAKCNIYNQPRMPDCQAGACSCQMKSASFPCQKQEALGKMEIGQ